MTLPSAVALWGADVVEKALAERSPDPATPELAREVHAHATDPHALARWALTLPWHRFCAVVRMAAGETRHDLTRDDDG